MTICLAVVNVLWDFKAEIQPMALPSLQYIPLALGGTIKLCFLYSTLSVYFEIAEHGNPC